MAHISAIFSLNPIFHFTVYSYRHSLGNDYVTTRD